MGKQKHRKAIDAAAKSGWDAGWIAALEEAATIAESYHCAQCGWDAAEAIRALGPKLIEKK